MDWQLVASYFTVKSTDVFFYSVCPFNSFEQMWGLSSLCPYFETKFCKLSLVISTVFRAPDKREY